MLKDFLYFHWIFFYIYFYLEIFTMSKNNIINCQICPSIRGDPRPWELCNWPLFLHHEAVHCLVYVSKFPIPTIPSSKCTILPSQNWFFYNIDKFLKRSWNWKKCIFTTKCLKAIDLNMLLTYEIMKFKNVFLTKKLFIFNVLKKWMCNIYRVWSRYNFKIFKFET